MDEKLKQRVEFSQRALAKLVQTFSRISEQNSRIISILKGSTIFQIPSYLPITLGSCLVGTDVTDDNSLSTEQEKMKGEYQSDLDSNSNQINYFSTLRTFCPQ